MKIQIDTKEKTIKVEETVNLGELCKVLDKLLPKEWKSYSLQSGSIIFWSNPIPWVYINPMPIIPLQPYYSTPPYQVTCSAGTDETYSIYNIEATIN